MTKVRSTWNAYFPGNRRRDIAVRKLLDVETTVGEFAAVITVGPDEGKFVIVDSQSYEVLHDQPFNTRDELIAEANERMKTFVEDVAPAARASKFATGNGWFTGRTIVPIMLNEDATMFPDGVVPVGTEVTVKLEAGKTLGTATVLVNDETHHFDIRRREFELTH